MLQGREDQTPCHRSSGGCKYNGHPQQNSCLDSLHILCTRRYVSKKVQIHNSGHLQCSKEKYYPRKATSRNPAHHFQSATRNQIRNQHALSYGDIGMALALWSTESSLNISRRICSGRTIDIDNGNDWNAKVKSWGERITCGVIIGRRSTVTVLCSKPGSIALIKNSS